MSGTILDWTALVLVVLFFVGLALLSRKTSVHFSWRVLIATVMGIVVGLAFAGHTRYVGIFGTIWSNLISAIVVPLLLFSIIANLGRLGGEGRLRKISFKTVILLLLNTLTAALIALGLGLAFHLGRGFNQALPEGYKTHQVPGVLDTMIGLFPTNLVENWAHNQVIPVVIFAILLAVSLNKVAATPKGERSVAPFKAFMEAGNLVLSGATQIVVGFTPYAVLSLIAAAVGGSSLKSLLPLLGVLLVAYLGLALQLFLVQPCILALVGHLNPIPFFRFLWPAGVVAFTSESSIGTIPVTVRQLRSAGVPEEIASFVASLGANLGMPGCAGLWPVLLAVFAMNAQGESPSLLRLALLIIFALVVSVGTVGVPGTATITATSLFTAAGLPVPFIAIMQPISQLVDMGRTLVNVAGAANTALIVAKTEGELDQELYQGEGVFSDQDITESNQVGSDVSKP